MDGGKIVVEGSLCLFIEMWLMCEVFELWFVDDDFMFYV